MNNQNKNTVNANPTKRFFVDMLTRDIELADAILDLVDNCVDGVQRTVGSQGSDTHKPYSGKWAKISIKPDMFVIEDNCGGIPENIAKNIAFRFGRPPGERDENIPTIGMYGIGMKRAIFKIGRECQVDSWHQPEDPYRVSISEDWIEGRNEDKIKEWELQLLPLSKKDTPLKEFGTRISISKILGQIALQFNEANTFIDDLKHQIKKSFAYIIEKGFAVFINGEEVSSEEIKLYVPKSWSDKKSDPHKNQIAPYVYKAVIDGVQVEVVVGFYRKLASLKDIEDLNKRGSRNNAGWTIICNERVVLYNDKSRLTGWGMNDVPSYHNQFIAIAGTVRFSCSDSTKLPLTTTKRGLETSSDIYLQVLNVMCEGLRKFTSFTNTWKKRLEEANEHFDELEQLTSTEIPEIAPAEKKPARSGKIAHNEFIPSLPSPRKAKKDVRVSFNATEEEVEQARYYFWEGLATKVKPSEVGKRCLEEICKHARKKSKKGDLQ